MDIKDVSAKRINSEFCKIVCSENFSDKLVQYSDVFSLLIPELKDLIGFPQNNPHHAYDVFNHTVHAIKQCESEDLTVRLAVFFHDFGKPHIYQDGEDGIRHFKGHGRVSADITDSVMRRLGFDNETRRNVAELVYYHDAVFKVGRKYIKRWLNKIGPEQFKRLLEVRKADIRGQRPDYEESQIETINSIKSILEDVLQEQECVLSDRLAVNGKDLIHIGYTPGKELGNTLNVLSQLVKGGGCPNEKEALLQEAKRRQ